MPTEVEDQCKEDCYEIWELKTKHWDSSKPEIAIGFTENGKFKDVKETWPVENLESNRLILILHFNNRIALVPKTIYFDSNYRFLYKLIGDEFFNLYIWACEY